MKAQLRSELLKLRSTRTTGGLLAAMLGLVLLAVLLHGYGLGEEKLSGTGDQLTLLAGWGAVIGGLFASLLGTLSFTGEVRYGTIGPTLLATPRRGRVVVAKAAAAMLAGAVFGVAATSVAALAAAGVLSARGVERALGAGDHGLLVIGGAAAAALWAAIGVGIGAVVRNQVSAVVGVLAWLLFVEGQLVGNVPGIGRLAPGALGQAMSGLDPGTPLAPTLGALGLHLYAAGVLAAGRRATIRRDFV